jgi:hypothetical protein
MDSHGFEEKQGQGDKCRFELSALRNHRTHGIEYGFHGFHGIKLATDSSYGLHGSNTESILTEWARAQPSYAYLFKAHLSHLLKAVWHFVQISTGTTWHPRALMGGFS